MILGRAARVLMTAERAVKGVIIIAAFAVFSSASPEVEPFNASCAVGEDIVTVNILSKQIRLLQEGKLDLISIKLPAGSIMENRSGGVFENVEKIKIQSRNKSIVLFTGSSEFSSSYSLKIFTQKKPALFSVDISGDNRQYPMPLEIINDGSIKILIRECLSRYAADSAYAEYGHVKEKYHEAVKAVAIVVKGRYYYNKRHPVHNGYDFCDLTHCQVYRGRAAPPKIARSISGWKIEMKNKSQMFFHSRCGGHTLGMSVFGVKADKSTGIRDWLSDTGIYLCRDKNSFWERELPMDELKKILFSNNSPEGIIDLFYDKKINSMRISGKSVNMIYPAEDFRLRVNRVKGWNYIKSNNYSLTLKRKDNVRLLGFSGWGLGHCVGLCQHGALSLAGLGYSMSEIIEHYFPGAKVKPSNDLSGNIPSVKKMKVEGDCRRYVNPDAVPYLSYVLFDLKSGKIEYSSYSSILNREIPAGSIFKIIVSLYLATERWDILKDYRYNCTGKGGDKYLPERCWNPRGHGSNSLYKALALSCNLYFASLYKKIEYKKFKIFADDLFRSLDIKKEIPEEEGTNFSRLLSGLDFRVKFSMSDLMRIIQLITPVLTDNPMVEEVKKTIPVEAADGIYRSLLDTIRLGTASGKLRPYGYKGNYLPLIENPVCMDSVREKSIAGKMWGKTSTLVHGTNRLFSYGVFIGADSERGVVVILRKGNGHIASKWGQLLLSIYSQ